MTGRPLSVDEAESELRRLALAAWLAAAAAEVVSVTVVRQRAEVVVQVGPGYPNFSYWRRADDGTWYETVSGNGPTVGWSDPTVMA